MKKVIKLTVLVGAIAVICTAFAACGTSKDSTKVNDTSKVTTNNNSNNGNTDNTKNSGTPSVNIVQGPEFTKTVLDKNISTETATPWKNSPGNKLSASLLGKGNNAKEEGIAKIICKDSSGKMWQLALSDTKKQNTPMYIEWWDDSNLLVIIGYGYGTVSLGGNLYLINVDNGKTALLMDNKDKSGKADSKQQIVNAVRNNNDIKYDVAVYEDDTMNKYHIENRILTSYADTLKGIAAGLK